ncbi:MAG TPA: beta-L-arabinofuranosidase domain-containing protein, partial [Verrucomicrobiae bacterium]|nr:beta-L-arabinofuranosidase domain-containing protein [Verrucomicrobiae bacterium]
MRNVFLLTVTMRVVLLLTTLATRSFAEEVKRHRLTQVPLPRVVIEDEFWSPKLKTWQEVTIPDAWTKFENDRGGAINNFDRVRDGKTGNHAGPEWYDGLIYEMIRASADFLITHPDPKLEERVEGYVTRIAAAAEKDPQGYIETWTELEAPNHRWGLNGGDDVRQHELYNAGALIEAGTHWYHATGKTDLLKVAVRMANNMVNLMGSPPKVNQVP